MNIPKSLTVYSDDERIKQSNESARIEALQKRHRGSQSNFSRYFGSRLSGEQIAASEKLLNAIETCAGAGIAHPSYDGISISSITYGPRDGISDYVLYARELIRLCQKSISDSKISGFQSYRILEKALSEDMTPQAVGDMVANQYRLKMGEKKRLELAFEIIDEATLPIVRVLKDLRIGKTNA